MEAKGKNTLGCFLFCFVHLFVCIFASSILLEIYRGSSNYNYVRRQGREKREDEISSAVREGTNGIRCGQCRHFRIVI